MKPQNSKQSRRKAVQIEQARRQSEQLALSPVSRDDFERLYADVAERAAAGGLGNIFELTRASLCAGNQPVDAVISFFVAHGIKCDWDLLVNADPCELFGPTSKRLARMPIERDELEALLDWLEKNLQTESCKHDLRMTRRWLDEHGLPIAQTEFALIAQGGGCDCEVLLNVDPEAIYPMVFVVSKDSIS